MKTPALHPLFLVAALSIPGVAQDANDPATELASFKLPPGFTANLFASEKDGVVKPIQIRWDTRGRLWVIQSTTYPQLKPGEEPNDKVLILEDTDGDGKCDKTTVFADGLMIPTGLEIAPTHFGTGLSGFNGLQDSEAKAESGRDAAGEPGKSLNPKNPAHPVQKLQSACYVGEGTKLWLLTDTDGDDKCDRREVVLRGFGTGDNHQNINSFRWSPGGELFFSQGLHAHSRVETPHGIVKLDHAGFFRYRPREQRLDAFYGGHADPQNPWGFVWTDWGQMLMVAGNNGGIFWPLPEMIRGVQNGKRDNLWVNARGRKTSGPDIVGTAHLPAEWQGRFITGGYINNAVWSLAIEDDGAGFKLTDREPLLTSTHTSFRPVDVKIGPEGAIYICDWYNPIIGHYQASFRHPERDKAHGRIWRVTYKDRPLVKPTPIAGASLPDLFENLKSPERWVREQTKRELAGRETGAVVKLARPLIYQYAVDDEWRTALEALNVLEAHDSLDGGILNILLSGPESIIRGRNADVSAYVAGVLGGWDSLDNRDYRTNRLLLLSEHKHPRVRLAAIVAAGNIPRQASTQIVLAASKQPEDKFINLALSSAARGLGLQFQQLLAPMVEFPADISTFLKKYTDIGGQLVGLEQAPDVGGTKLKRMNADKPAPIPATGKLRATPEFVAGLVKEVKERGDVKRGADVYRRAELACTTCHSLADAGGKIGPPLDAIGSGQPLDFIIGATLEPQREIKESYEAMMMTAKDGRIATGYIAARDAAQTTLRDPASGTETKFAAAELAEFKPLGSFMPAGLVDNLSREDLRDLFAYLAQLGKPQP